jgi:bacillithiol system protein YtxJ
MIWIKLDSEEQLNEIKAKSANTPQVIFKHSTTCSISAMALNRLERSSVPGTIDFYLLDLLRFRSVSNKVAEEFDVHHQSPQVLLIKNGECVYEESHMGISASEIVEVAASSN